MGRILWIDESMVKLCLIKKGEEWRRKVCFEFTQWSLLDTAEFSLSFLSATTGAGAKTYKSVNMCLVMQHCRLHTCVTDKGKSYWAKLACFDRQISCHPHSFRWSHGRWLGGLGANQHQTVWHCVCHQDIILCTLSVDLCYYSSR